METTGYEGDQAIKLVVFVRWSTDPSEPRRCALEALGFGEPTTASVGVHDIDAKHKEFDTLLQGETLRAGLVQLGPVFVKVGQTLAQRPDVVGEEAAAELKSLQVDAKPFSNKYAFLDPQDLNHSGPLAPGLCPAHCDKTQRALFAEFTPQPVAAASLGQVYKARTHDGVWLAVKVSWLRAVLWH
eukprot:s393_g19.t1